MSDTVIAVPEGYALVPIKPTDEMKRAAFGPILHGGRGGPVTSDFIRQEAALTFWPMMIAAAPATHVRTELTIPEIIAQLPAHDRQYFGPILERAVEAARAQKASS